MKTFLKTAALAATMIAAPLAAQTLPPPVIVVVDMERVFQTSAAGKQAQTELKARIDGVQARVKSLRTQFGAEEQALAKTRPTAPGAAATAWETKVRDFQARQQKEEADLAKRNQEFQEARQYVVKQLQDGSNPIITTIMREKGATIALAEGATLQHSQAIDVTTDVVARLDKSMPRVSTTAPAAPAAR